MTWLLMWLNMSVATLNATLQLLVIYRFAEIRTYGSREQCTRPTQKMQPPAQMQTRCYPN